VTSASAAANRRQRVSIRPHRGGYQVRVTAGTEPATGERIVLTETGPTLKEAVTVRRVLLAAGHECWTAADANLYDAPDDALAVYPADHSAALISHDAEFARSAS
jgi:hypothetical protein